MRTSRILIDNAHRKIEAGKLEDALLLPFYAPARTAFSGIFSLIDPRIRRAAGRGAGAAAALRGA